MSPFDYSLVLDETGDKATFALLLDHRRDIEHGFSVSIGFRSAFKSVHPLADVERAADAFALALAIYVADWLCVRRNDEVSHIRIVLPIWRPDLYAALEVHLRDLLRLYTGDEWHFEWKQRIRSERRPSVQMQFEGISSPEVALWSGGLDSFGGWWSRYRSASASSYLLVGSGASDVALGLQRQLHREALHLAERVHPLAVELAQVPLFVFGAAMLRKEPSQRSRGFVFALVGAVCAFLRGQDNLHVYENGVGAINLPYCAAEVGLDHARSVHPSSLFEMSRLVEMLFDRPFLIWNPFVFATKAEVCEPLTQLASLTPFDSPIFTTSSCDSPHRQLSRPAQCGYCTSCLLRRQALGVNGIEDQTRYALWSKVPHVSDSHALRAMLHQVDSLRSCLTSEHPWPDLLRCFPSLAEALSPTVTEQAGSKEAAQSALVELYRRYCQEWEQVENNLWNGLRRPDLAVAAKQD